MATNPAFLFYSSDFYTGVATMSFEDRGKFITILCLMHQKGRLKETAIKSIVGEISSELKSKFIIDDQELWYNERLELEADKREAFSESRRNNGKGYAKAYEKHMQQHKPKLMDNEKEIEKENKKEIEIAFEKYLEMRKKIKKPATDHAIDLAKKKLFKLSDGIEELAIEILNNSILNCWQDLYPLKDKQSKTEKLGRINKQELTDWINS